MSRRRDKFTLSMFGDGLLPDVHKPAPDFIRRPDGEWMRFCPAVEFFNAVLPASWSAGYSREHQPEAPQLLLTWHPGPGCLVKFRPGSHAEMGALKHEITHPLRVIKRWTLDGYIRGVWVQPTHTDRPISQAPVMVCDLLPAGSK